MEKLSDKEWLEAQVAKLPVRHIAKQLGVPYTRAYLAVKKFGITIPQRNGYIYSEEARANKSAAQKAAYKLKYPNGRHGELHPNWKGGRRTKGHGGYIRVYAPEHPRAVQGSIFEHILVAEKKIGRYLEKNEIVHHINHKKDDNRPENLQVLTKSQHVTAHWDKGRVQAERIKYLEKLLDTNNIPY